MKKVVSIVCLMAGIGFALASTGNLMADEEKPLIQIAILLDTSNSMDGLINQARTQLWRIVNEFATAKREGKEPELQVALYEYGNDRLPREKGYVRQVLPLTTDLDKVSEGLFSLKTFGGEEYCGYVIKDAVENLNWSKSDSALKIIVIAGNEPFTQGPVDYKEACKAAINKGIIVNTIFCGPYADGANMGWKDGATLADGKYMNIDQEKQQVQIEAPQDKEIQKLGAELNKTYVPFGKRGREGKLKQEEMDEKLKEAAPAAAVERQAAKASKHYDASSWDLVDAVKKGEVKLEDVKDEDLPEEMRKMSLEEKKRYIEEKAKERERLQAEIKKQNAEREKYIAEEMKKLGEKEDSFGAALIKAVREQAEKKNFKFEEKK
jgi:hypothetical protein